MINMKNDRQTKFFREYLKIKEEECKDKGNKFGKDLYRLWRKTFLS